MTEYVLHIIPRNTSKFVVTKLSSRSITDNVNTSRSVALLDHLGPPISDMQIDKQLD